MKTKTETNFLEHVKELLQEQNIPSTLNSQAIDNKIDTLFIPFEGTNIGLTLMHITNENFKNAGVEQDVGLVQYHIAIPIAVEKTQMAHIAEFIQRLNLNAPIPGWILDRSNNVIHYRYVQVCEKSPPSDELFSYIMNVISFYMTQYLPIVIDLCLARVQFEEAISKINAATR